MEEKFAILVTLEERIDIINALALQLSRFNGDMGFAYAKRVANLIDRIVLQA